MTLYTPIVSTDDVNALEVNERYTELSDAIKNRGNGTTALPSPAITSFANAAHDHEDAAGGGQLTVAAINSGAATDGQVATADGAGNVAWEDPAGTFLDLTDTPSSFSGLGGYKLQVNSGATAIEAVPDTANIQENTLDEGADYTTTSTSFVDINATTLSLDITVQTGSRGITVEFNPVVFGSGVIAISFEITVDGTPVAGNDGVATLTAPAAAYRVPININAYIPLSAGTYTIRIQWKVSTGTGTLLTGAGTANGDVHPQLRVREVI